jgi:hypothetical protein
MPLPSQALFPYVGDGRGWAEFPIGPPQGGPAVLGHKQNTGRLTATSTTISGTLSGLTIGDSIIAIFQGNTPLTAASGITVANTAGTTSQWLLDGFIGTGSTHGFIAIYRATAQTTSLTTSFTIASSVALTLTMAELTPPAAYVGVVQTNDTINTAANDASNLMYYPQSNMLWIAATTVNGTVNSGPGGLWTNMGVVDSTQRGAAAYQAVAAVGGQPTTRTAWGLSANTDYSTLTVAYQSVFSFSPVATGTFNFNATSPQTVSLGSYTTVANDLIAVGFSTDYAPGCTCGGAGTTTWTSGGNSTQIGYAAQAGQTSFTITANPNGSSLNKTDVVWAVFQGLRSVSNPVIGTGSNGTVGSTLNLGPNTVSIGQLLICGAGGGAPTPPDTMSVNSFAGWSRIAFLSVQRVTQLEIQTAVTTSVSCNIVTGQAGIQGGIAWIQPAP